MMDEIDLRQVKMMIRQELAPILMGIIQTTNDTQRATITRMKNEQQIPNLRRIAPFGFASRPPDQTQCMSIPIGGDYSNINIVGEFDLNRPVLNKGEAALYNASGQVIAIKANGTIRQGSQTASSPVVLGDILQAFADALINAFLNASQVGQSPTGPVFLDPGVRSALNQAKSTFVDTASSNFLSQTNFVQR